MIPFDHKAFIDKVWYQARDIVSDGYDQALNHIKELLPEMKIHKYPSGMETWSWIIPPKWNLKNAYIKSSEGKILVDMQDHPLHVVSYSTPISGKISGDELRKHLHTRPQCPKAIPFEFSYYQKNWGFCVPHVEKDNFQDDEYNVLIDSSFEEGELKVGDFYIPGKTDQEYVIMSHLCHPYQAEDGISGISTVMAVAQHFRKTQNSHYSLRFLFVPESIGSIAFLSQNEHLIEKMQGCIFLEMLGHDDQLSLQKSRQGDSVLDKAAEICLEENKSPYRVGKFCEVIVNDEKIFNGPGVNIPSISLSRSKFWGRGEWPFPQYHTSFDTPDIICPKRLEEASQLTIGLVNTLNENYNPQAKVKGPIFLSRYDLWVDWRIDRELNQKQEEVFYYLHDNNKTLIDIACELQIPFPILKDWLEKFYEHGLIEKKFN